MTEKPLEQILTDFRQFLEVPAEVHEIDRILHNYQNRSLSGNEHEQLRQLYFSLNSGMRKKYHSELKAKFMERAELDLNGMESVQTEPDPKISASRYENILAALKSYKVLGRKLKFPDSVMSKIKHLTTVYKNSICNLRSDNKYVYFKSRLKRKGLEQNQNSARTSAVKLIKNENSAFLGTVLNNFNYKKGYGYYHKYYYNYESDGKDYRRHRGKYQTLN